MSILEVTEDWTGGTSDESSADESRLQVIGVSTLAFDVIFNSDCTTAAALSPAAIAMGVPARYDIYPGQPWLFADHRHAVRVNPLHVKVTVDYLSVEDPLNADPEYSWDFVVSQEPVDRDNSDNPIANSADEPVDPPITEPVYDMVLRYRDNIASFSPSLAEGFIGAVNTDSFLGYTAGKVKCTKHTGTPARAAANPTYLPTGKYFVRDMEFIFRSDSWQRKFLDEGFRTKTGTDGDGKPTYAIMKDEDDNPLSLPVKLNGSGVKLSASADAVFNTFALGKTAAFSGLGVVV